MGERARGSTVARAAGPVRAAVAVAVALSALLGAFAQAPARAAEVAVPPPATIVDAAAPCAPPPLEVAIPSGQVVIVGSVERVDNAGRWATVRVEERWYGAASLPDVVSVHGGPDPGTATAADRTFTEGARYLFVVRRGAGSLEDDLCTATRPWSEELARYRPRGVAAAIDAAGEPTGFRLPPNVVPVVALVAALVIAVVSYRFILLARRRPPDWMR